MGVIDQSTLDLIDELMSLTLAMLEGDDWKFVADSPALSVYLAALVKEGVTRVDDSGLVFNRIRHLLINSKRVKPEVFDVGVDGYTKTINNARVLQIIKAHKLTVAPIDIEQDEGWVAMLATWQGSSHPFEATTLEDAVLGWQRKYGQKDGR